MNPQLLGLLMSPMLPTIIGVVGAVLWAWFTRSKNAMQSTIDAIPTIYDAVRAQRVKAGMPPLPFDAQIEDMLKMGAAFAGRALTAVEANRVKQELVAHDARLSVAGHVVTPVTATQGPTLGGIPVVSAGSIIAAKSVPAVTAPK